MAPCSFRNIAVIATGVFLLLGSAMPAMCQSEPAQAEEPPMEMEEVIVLGSKSLLDLERELYRAEEVLYDLFNSFNMDDDLDVQCYRQAPIGSRIKQRVCKTNGHRELLRRASQSMMMGERYVYPVAEIKHLEKRLLTNMTETALEQPEMLEALSIANQAKQTLESERKRRCESRFLFCW